MQTLWFWIRVCSIQQVAVSLATAAGVVRAQARPGVGIGGGGATQLERFERDLQQIRQRDYYPTQAREQAVETVEQLSGVVAEVVP